MPRTHDGWLYLAHVFVAFATMKIAEAATVGIITGEVFGPAVFIAGAALTIAILFWGEWMEAIDPLITG